MEPVGKRNPLHRDLDAQGVTELAVHMILYIMQPCTSERLPSNRSQALLSFNSRELTQPTAKRHQLRNSKKPCEYYDIPI